MRRLTYQIIMFNQVYSSTYEDTRKLKKDYDLMAQSIGSENIVVVESAIERTVKSHAVDVGFMNGDS